MKKVSKIKRMDVKLNPAGYVAGVLFIALIILALFFVLKPKDERMLLEIGNIEKTGLYTAFVVKKEAVINQDPSKIMVPVTGEGSKVPKGGIVATYRGEEYTNYEETLARMDKEILDLMQDLPPIYSSEIDTIDKTIYSLIKESIDETSYSKMQEYKQRINSYINKRAGIIGELSPAGAEIKELIEERNKYEAKAKKSNDNILAPITGLVSYKTDGLEEKLKIDDIEKLSYALIKNYIDEDIITNTSEIKVVNNYEAYIVTKVGLELKDYIKKGYDYEIRLIESNNQTLEAELTKTVEVEDGYELYFKITNGIEYIVDLRKIEIEIVWWKKTGLVVMNELLNKYDNKDANYIYAVKYSEVVKVPVKVVRQNDKYSVIDNYSKEELKELQIETDYKIKLHDRIILKANKEKK
ncbi:MAG: hypothetical protein IKL68_00045 [Clostridia bacterium]|nr:hypothetical protein [Clostridia bacterium]